MGIIPPPPKLSSTTFGEMTTESNPAIINPNIKYGDISNISIHNSLMNSNIKLFTDDDIYN